MSKYDYKRAYKIAHELINDLKYFHWEIIIGLIGTICGHYNAPLNQDTLDGIKQAILDDFYGGVEIEWNFHGLWQWWENLSPDWFELVPATHAFTKQPCAPNIICYKRPSDFKEE